MTINQRHAAFLEGRKISVSTAISMGIYSGAIRFTGDESRVEPDEGGNVLVYPFLLNGEVVNEKYRLPQKQFRQLTGGLQTFYNADILTDKDLTSGNASLVICEGEMDALACIEAGYKYAVSVPSGASQPKKIGKKVIPVPEDSYGIDPEDDKKFEFVYSNIEEISMVKRIIIATDNDEAGIHMAAELVRRIGRVRCSFVTWPEDVKDMNDVLIKYGPSKVLDLIKNAKPYPLSGVYTLDELPPEPPPVFYSTGWPQFGVGEHGLLKVCHPALMIVTGRAGHGKSTWTQQLVTNLANNHGLKAAIASFEMLIDPYIINAIGAAYLGRPSQSWDNADKIDVRGFINDNFVFIAPRKLDDELRDVTWLMARLEEAVIRHNVRVILIDPWNEIEHARERNETTTEYTNRAVSKLRSFAHRHDLLLIIVAHPTKSGAAKDPEDITLYDIADSAAFQNKADIGVVVYRLSDAEGKPSTSTGISLTKIRHEGVGGELGVKELQFDKLTRTFG